MNENALPENDQPDELDQLWSTLEAQQQQLDSMQSKLKRQTELTKQQRQQLRQAWQAVRSEGACRMCAHSAVLKLPAYNEHESAAPVVHCMKMHRDIDQIPEACSLRLDLDQLDQMEQ